MLRTRPRGRAAPGAARAFSRAAAIADTRFAVWFGISNAAESAAHRLVAAVLGEHDAHEVGGVLRPELFHDARPMHLHGAR